MSLLHVSLNYPERHHVVPCSHMFSCVFLKLLKYCSVLTPLISPHPEGKFKADENIWNMIR